ncbi:LOW QUALITY PROTEIN: hypothetical protein SC1083_0386 [Aggregatibacter actinomycetemcomitans serotype e str. SC1083]|uniref:Uncharacterized protein n=1 Tax=Aggregatibacter actinomycetemcomitans serotype e str. SC1083 TaxID=907488 RepID=G4A6E6_AGGAC|nr:LOW QUALITY PROTEIN: hypothetical protein SC1083_0386 [Aggregatibacter actinomycetemcomitans serotype e str. SC1083]
MRILDIVYLQFFALRTASIFPTAFRRNLLPANNAIKIATIFAKLKSTTTCPSILIISTALWAWSCYRFVFNPHLRHSPNIRGRHQARKIAVLASSHLTYHKARSNLAAKCRNACESHRLNQTALQGELNHCRHRHCITQPTQFLIILAFPRGLNVPTAQTHY